MLVFCVLSFYSYHLFDQGTCTDRARAKAGRSFSTKTETSSPTPGPPSSIGFRAPAGTQGVRPWIDRSTGGPLNPTKEQPKRACRVRARHSHAPEPRRRTRRRAWAEAGPTQNTTRTRAPKETPPGRTRDTGASANTRARRRGNDEAKPPCRAMSKATPGHPLAGLETLQPQRHGKFLVAAQTREWSPGHSKLVCQVVGPPAPSLWVARCTSTSAGSVTSCTYDAY